MNAGLDETFDLGKGRSAAAVAERGRGRVYLDFLRSVHGLAAARGRRLQFWGDIVLEHPELIAELPEDVIALEWGYEAEHPFAEHAQRFAEAERDFYVCPGTSSWSSFAGRSRNALANLANAARNGHAAGAQGYLVTDWGDFGHLQPATASHLGFLAGAGFAWNVATAQEADALPWADLLDRYAFASSRGLGRIAYELGNTYNLTGTPSRNGSALFFLLVFAHQPLTEPRYRGMTREHLARATAHVEEQRTALTHRTGDEAKDGLAWTADMLALCCRFGSARLENEPTAPLHAIQETTRRDLAHDLVELEQRCRDLWLRHHRPGGLDDALSYLQRPRRWLEDGKDLRGKNPAQQGR